MAKKNLSTIKRLLKSFKEGCNISMACKNAGISRVIFYKWTSEWPNLDKRIKQLMDVRTEMVIDAIYMNAIEGKEASQKLWMLNHGWNGEGSKITVPVDIKNTNVNSANVIPVATQEEAERVKSYAELIRSHNLVSRTLGQEGHEPVPRVDIEGRQGEESSAGAAAQGDSVAH